MNSPYRDIFKVLQSYVITYHKRCWLRLHVTLTKTSIDHCANPVAYVTVATFERCGKILVWDDELKRKTITSLRNASR